MSRIIARTNRSAWLRMNCSTHDLVWSAWSHDCVMGLFLVGGIVGGSYNSQRFPTIRLSPARESTILTHFKEIAPITHDLGPRLRGWHVHPRGAYKYGHNGHSQVCNLFHLNSGFLPIITPSNLIVGGSTAGNIPSHWACLQEPFEEGARSVCSFSGTNTLMDASWPFESVKNLSAPYFLGYIP